MWLFLYKVRPVPDNVRKSQVNIDLLTNPDIYLTLP